MGDIRILDVTGYYQYGGGFHFVEQQSWKGTVLLRTDLTFEGIVVDQHVKTNFDRLVYGTLAEYSGTSLIKFANHDLAPCGFWGFATEGNVVLGTWSSYDYFKQTIRGRTKIIFKERSLDQAIIADITSKIQGFKENMDPYSKAIYDDLTQNISATAIELAQGIEQEKDALESEIGSTLKKLEL